MPIIAVMSWPRNKKALLDLFRSSVVDRDQEAVEMVRRILGDVERGGDRSLFAWAEKLDGVPLDAGNVRVSRREIDAGYKAADPGFIAAARTAIGRIQAFHEYDGLKDWRVKTEQGSIMGKLVRPIRSVGVCVPGKRAPLPTTLIMCAVPARLAGVERIAVVTPPGVDGAVHPSLLAAARLLDIDEIYRIGGAQAVGALAYGTASVEPVVKIVGPGSVWVQLAKKEVFGRVGIDMIAGPSELAVLADGGDDPAWVAADMLSQLEHGQSSRAFLVTDSASYISQVSEALNAFMCAHRHEKLLRRSIKNSAMVKVDSLEVGGVDVINHLAPEHVQIMARRAEPLVKRIRAAGAVFVGRYSPEPIGDYIAGPNHSLPTGGTAMFSSPLGVRDFQTQMSYIKITKLEFQSLWGEARTLAAAEGLECHADSLAVRFDPSSMAANRGRGPDGENNGKQKKSADPEKD